jgi:hypothetical protein
MREINMKIKKDKVEVQQFWKSQLDSKKDLMAITEKTATATSHVTMEKLQA